MKKITFYVLTLLLLGFSYNGIAQTLNQNASWPNVNWTVTGTFNADPTAFEADPTTTSNFAYDDDDAGNPSDDDIAAESPVIDLTVAHGAGETWLTVTADYVYYYLSNDELVFQYWDADGASWLNWDAPFSANTAGAPTDDFCSGTAESYTTVVLNIATFTANQQSGFRYRISYNDDPNGADWNYGFCFQSPTITSSTPPSCPDPISLAMNNVTHNSADFSWTEAGSAGAWDIELVDITGGGSATGTPTVTGHNSETYNFTGLADVNDYDAYVRADCGGTGTSNWVGPISFTTLAIPPANDDCANAISLTPGTVYNDNPVDGTLIGATDSGFTNSCGGTAVNDVWYSIVVPADGNITIETAEDIATATAGNDTAIEAYSGDCGTLVSIGCDDDGAATGAYSFLDLTGLTPSSTIYVRLWGYGDDEFEPFSISVYNPILSIGEVAFEGFSFYPNPVKDILTLNSPKEINNVSIYNMLGQEVLRISPNVINSEIDMSAFQSGAYFVKVTINNTIETIRIVKR